MREVMDGFHERDGWTFKRLEFGSVRIRKHHPADQPTEGDDPTSYIEHVITAAEWASIVAAVSKDGGSARSYETAVMLHG